MYAPGLELAIRIYARLRDGNKRVALDVRNLFLVIHGNRVLPGVFNGSLCCGC